MDDTGTGRRTTVSGPMKRLLLLGVGLMGRPYAHAARRLGVHVTAVETAANADGVRDLVDAVSVLSRTTDEAWAEAAYLAAGRSTFDGVLAFSEPQVVAAALLHDRLGLPGPSLHAAVLSRNKGLQRARFQACGLRQPEYTITPSLTQARPWALSRFPVVVKPLSRSGSEGVEHLPDAAAFDRAAARRADETPLLVETAVHGQEYSWEALLQNGKVWFENVTWKETTGPPHFVETCHRPGAPLSPADAEEVRRLGREVVSALGMRTGLVHLEFRLAQHGPTIMEVAVRTPGDFILDALGITYGFDWFEIAVRLAVGLPLPAPPDQRVVAHAASVFLTARPGTVAAVRGLQSVRADPRVVAAQVDVTVGDVLSGTTSSAARVGWALLRAPDPAELESVLRRVRSTLSVQTSTRNGSRT
jgi:biotin carboxylase